MADIRYKVIQFFTGRVLILSLVLVSLFSSGSAALSPPSLRCISVLPNGNINLDWVVNSDTGSVFGGYHIYFSNNISGPFAIIDSIFAYATTSYIHTGVNANNSSYYYYIKTRDGCCSNYSLSSDTLKSIRLILTPQSNEVVRINWNRIHTPPLPTTVSGMKVQKDIPGPAFANFITSIDTTIQDTNYFCNQFINYRVVIDDASGCQSISSIDGELFRDTKGPSKPILDTVSVDIGSGEGIITWLPDSSPDTQGYVIYEFNGVSYDSIGAVFGINNLFFQYALSDASNLSEVFSVAAFDSCKNLSSLADNHNTIFLEGQFSKCDAAAELSWNEYVNMAGLNRYEIWYRVNSGSWVRDGFVPPNVLNYTLNLTQPGGLYEILIRAKGAIGTSSSSNIISLTADLFNYPDYLYIRSASVSGNNVNVLVFADPAADVKKYRLYRSENGISGFTLIAEQPYSPVSTITFTDVSADPDIRSYYYKVTATDSCGVETFSDNIARTVHLSVSSDGGPINFLEWNDYGGWPGPTGYFNIYRVVNGAIQTPQFANVINGVLTFTDDVSSLGGVLDEYCYVVEALEEQINTYGFIDSAFSNIACVVQEPFVFIPNAFTPGGKNPVFKPVVVFGDPTTYDLVVFNRWGQRVFESSNPSYGWDGSYEGEACPTGIYIYQVIFKGFNQKEINRTGTLMLLK